MQTTFVFAHGSWHGGWCWQRLGRILVEKGHTVATPSYTGMGDRAHLLSGSITLETFIQDLVSVIETNESRDVVLVGHSFGGVPIAGVADRIPEKLRHLIFLDSLILEGGQTPFDMYAQDEVAARVESARRDGEGLAVPPPKKLPSGWGLEEGSVEYDWVVRRLRPHPLRSYMSPLELRNPYANGLPKTYLECTDPPSVGLSASRDLVRSQPDWNYVQVAAPHDAMITHPEKISKILLSV